MVNRRSPSSVSPVGGALVLLAFGAWLLLGAYVALTGGQWPPFMPPQFDLLAVPLTFISRLLGAVVGGLLAGIVGLLCVAAAIGLLLRAPKSHGSAWLSSHNKCNTGQDG